MLCAFANEQFNVLLFSLGCKQQNSSSVMFEELVMLLPLEQERPSLIIKKQNKIKKKLQLKMLNVLLIIFLMEKSH